MQRVTGGRLRGRKLLALPAGRDGARPTSSKVRAAIFDRIQGEVQGARVLDLCAGSGALAIEALSRGAGFARLVESHPATVRFLERQLQALDLKKVAQVSKLEALRFVRGQPDSSFDLVFLDPPYESTRIYDELPGELGPWLAPEALLIVESRSRNRFLPPQGWVHEARKEYGEAALDFLRWPGDKTVHEHG